MRDDVLWDGVVVIMIIVMTFSWIDYRLADRARDQEPSTGQGQGCPVSFRHGKELEKDDGERV
jgi:hypothetical protein